MNDSEFEFRPSRQTDSAGFRSRASATLSVQVGVHDRFRGLPLESLSDLHLGFRSLPLLPGFKSALRLAFRHQRRAPRLRSTAERFLAGFWPGSKHQFLSIDNAIPKLINNIGLTDKTECTIVSVRRHSRIPSRAKEVMPSCCSLVKLS
jgi:hypothetical protein